MTNAEGIPNDEIRNSDDEACLFGIPASSLIRHSSFELRHFHFISSPSFLLHDNDLARRFFLRQGLWTEGLRTPPGQECSNGSLTFFAVVLWRTFVAMKLLNVKTTRFAQIVEKSGRPEPYTLWQKPSADRHLQSQIKNNRVMTIQRSESGTEFGIVGFRQAQGARYLIFPKSLKRFENRRVVGINWDLLRAK